MKKFLLFFVILFSVINLYSQSNEVIDEVLKQDHIDFKNAVYMILVAGELIDESTTPEFSLIELEKLNWSIKIKDGDEKLTLSDAVLLIMRSLDLKGGVMYTLLPVKRYAYKEMVFKKLVDPTDNLERFVSGYELMTIISRSLEYKNGGPDA